MAFGKKNKGEIETFQFLKYLSSGKEKVTNLDLNFFDIFWADQGKIASKSKAEEINFAIEIPSCSLVFSPFHAKLKCVKAFEIFSS